MVYERVIGEIENIGGQTYVEWKFPIRQLTSINFDFIDSPKFYFLNSEWSLRLDYTERMVFVNLYGECPKSDHTVTFIIGIKDLKPIIKSEPKTTTFLKKSLTVKSIAICEIDDFRKRINKHVLGETWTVYCKAISNPSSIIDKELKTGYLSNTTGLSADFQDLLLSGRKSDVRIEVQGQAFGAHKIILESRSSVFSAMLENDMTESDGIIKIEDCDPDTFKHFLECLYTGKTENVSSDNVFSLYAVSDKYCVQDIKGMCLAFMETELSVDTVCDVFELAGKCKETRLKESAENFLIKNMKSVLLTKTWGSFMAENSLVASQILMKAYQAVAS